VRQASVHNWLMLLPLAVAFAACTTTTTTTSGLPEARDARAAAESGDPERRASVRLELAGLYFQRGQGETALEEVNRALAAKPELAPAHNLRGLILASLDQAVAAERAFQRSLQLAPADGATMHNYGWFLCQQRRFSEGDAQFINAVAQPLYRDAPRTFLAQGVCQARAGQWGDAERSLSRSFELDPANPATAFNLAEVLLRRGELERARFYVGRIHGVPAQVSAQSLWLAARIERRLGNIPALQDLGNQMRERFPQSPETVLFERGRFDD
jgi:type IV pilus assembly protein PilF